MSISYARFTDADARTTPLNFILFYIFFYLLIYYYRIFNMHSYWRNSVVLKRKKNVTYFTSTFLRFGSFLIIPLSKLAKLKLIKNCNTQITFLKRAKLIFRFECDSVHEYFTINYCWRVENLNCSFSDAENNKTFAVITKRPQKINRAFKLWKAIERSVMEFEISSNCWNNWRARTKQTFKFQQSYFHVDNTRADW